MYVVTASTRVRNYCTCKVCPGEPRRSSLRMDPADGSPGLRSPICSWGKSNRRHLRPSRCPFAVAPVAERLSEVRDSAKSYRHDSSPSPRSRSPRCPGLKRPPTATKSRSTTPTAQRPNISKPRAKAAFAGFPIANRTIGIGRSTTIPRFSAAAVRDDPGVRKVNTPRSRRRLPN